MNLVGAAGLGVGLGVVTGMPLGVANVAIVDAAAAGRRRFAVGVGVGSAIADTVHASLAFVGVGRLVTAHPALVRVLAIAAAIVIVGYAVTAWRRRPVERVPSDVSSGVRGGMTGLALTLPNPGALLAWVAVASSLWSDATPGEALALGIGVGVGSAAWFAALATWVSRVRPDHPALRYVPRLALVALVAIAAIGIIKIVVRA